MNRITEVTIGGKSYPLNFSTKAAKEMAKRYGDLSSVGGAFQGRSTAEMMDEAVWMLHLLIEQGVAYHRIVDGKDVPGITADELEVVLGVSDLPALQDQLMKALRSGMGRTVEVEDDTKNAEATQGA